MSKAIVTVGLGFGDEGKGSAVDYLCRVHNADLVVRYSGGHQCGHNVVLPNGTHHCFHQFGSGTFAGAKTYLDQHVIIEPLSLLKEAQELQNKGISNPLDLMTINWGCLVTTPWHKLLNQIKEIHRGNDKHGSCGLGVGETRKFALDHYTDALKVCDYCDVDLIAWTKEKLLQEAMVFESDKTLDRIQCMYNLCPKKYKSAIKDILSKVNRILPTSKKLFRCAVYEGAQGVLLDEYYGFYPYTTWSTVTSKHALEHLEHVGCTDTIVLGITRAYHTRHGNGPFPTYDSILPIPVGEHNQTNDWQNNFRVGYLDLPLLKYALKADGNIDGIFLTCVDHVSWNNFKYAIEHNNLGKLSNRLDNPVVSLGYNRSEKLSDVLMDDNLDTTYKIGHINDVFYTGGGIMGIPVICESNGPTYKHKLKGKV